TKGRGDPQSLGAGDRRHLGGDELSVQDRDKVGEGAADVAPDAYTGHHAIFPRIGLRRQMATTKMPSSLEIAQQATLRPIAELAADIALDEDRGDLFRLDKCKIGVTA